MESPIPRDTFVEKPEEIHIWISSQYGQAVPKVKAKRLSWVYMQKLGPSVVVFDAQECTKIGQKGSRADSDKGSLQKQGKQADRTGDQASAVGATKRYAVA